MVKGKHGGCWCKDHETPYSARKFPLQVQYPKSIHQPERRLVGLGECESHYLERNSKQGNIKGWIAGRTERLKHRKYRYTGKRSSRGILLQSKAVHGLHQIAEVVDIVMSYQWLEKAGLKGNMTETLTMVAQEQALDPSKQGTIGLKCRPRKTPQKRSNT